jgi:hypothetical protein
VFRYTSVYPKVSGLAARSENRKWYSSLLQGAVVSPFCEFCHHNPLCCFSTSVCCCLFRYQLSPETFGYTLVLCTFLKKCGFVTFMCLSCACCIRTPALPLHGSCCFNVLLMSLPGCIVLYCYGLVNILLNFALYQTMFGALLYMSFDTEIGRGNRYFHTWISLIISV